MRTRRRPDPRRDPYRYLDLRTRELTQANNRAAEAQLYAAAHELRTLWPTVGTLVFSERALRRPTSPTRALLWLEEPGGQILSDHQALARRIEHDPATRVLLANILSGVMVALRQANASLFWQPGQDWAIRTRQRCDHPDGERYTVVELPPLSRSPRPWWVRAREVATLWHASAEGAPYHGVTYGSRYARWTNRLRYGRRYLLAAIQEITT